MSSEKTEYYQLHRWQKDDDFLREEFNENFAILDDKILRVVTGSYTCDGVDGRLIDLGFEPKAVLVFDEAGTTWYSGGNSTEFQGGLAIPGHKTGLTSFNQYRTLLEIVPTGFTVHSNGVAKSNYDGIRYYLALR